LQDETVRDNQRRKCAKKNLHVFSLCLVIYELALSSEKIPQWEWRIVFR